jgi:AP endonuclease-1
MSIACTCRLLSLGHAFAAGYDIRTSDTYAATIGSFDKIVGLGYLKGMHLNDSKTELGGKKDRHENIGL